MLSISPKSTRRGTRRSRLRRLCATGDGDGFTDCTEHSGDNSRAYGGDPLPGCTACGIPIDRDSDGCPAWGEIVDMDGSRRANTLDALMVARRVLGRVSR